MQAGFYYMCILSSTISLWNMEEEKEKDNEWALSYLMQL